MASTNINMITFEKFLAKRTVTAMLKRMVFGYLIGLTVISFIIFGVTNTPEEWGLYWRVKPLIITPLATAFGILSFYGTSLLEVKTVSLKVFFYLLSLLVFLISLWLGTIVGLDGTLWN